MERGCNVFTIYWKANQDISENSSIFFSINVKRDDYISFKPVNIINSNTVYLTNTYLHTTTNSLPNFWTFIHSLMEFCCHYPWTDRLFKKIKEKQSYLPYILHKFSPLLLNFSNCMFQITVFAISWLIVCMCRNILHMID